MTITDAKALDEPVKDAIKKGIPVVAINVPDSRGFEEKIPYLAYVGADDYMVGIEGGKRMLKEFGDTPPKRGVVLIHEVGHTGLEARAKGFTGVFAEKGITYPSFLASMRIRCLVASLTSDFSRNARETVLTDTPAFTAISCNRTRFLRFSIS